ncbi:MAG TPA: hypothetical protein DDX91_02035, partial [Ruminococcaceae bacterium]|nr:hypothetical protein [Oscillospiraceae bacterium]
KGSGAGAGCKKSIKAKRSKKANAVKTPAGAHPAAKRKKQQCDRRTKKFKKPNAVQKAKRS